MGNLLFLLYISISQKNVLFVYVFWFNYLRRIVESSSSLAGQGGNVQKQQEPLFLKGLYAQCSSYGAGSLPHHTLEGVMLLRALALQLEIAWSSCIPLFWEPRKQSVVSSGHSVVALTSALPLSRSHHLPVDTNCQRAYKWLECKVKHVFFTWIHIPLYQ